jgi:hypothetical protein
MFRLGAHEARGAAIGRPRAVRADASASIEGTSAAEGVPREAIVETSASIFEPSDAPERNLAAQSAPRAAQSTRML